MVASWFGLGRGPREDRDGPAGQIYTSRGCPLSPLNVALKTTEVDAAWDRAFIAARNALLKLACRDPASAALSRRATRPLLPLLPLQRSCRKAAPLTIPPVSPSPRLDATADQQRQQASKATMAALLPTDALFLAGFATAAYRALGRWMKFSADDAKTRSGACFLCVCFVDGGCSAPCVGRDAGGRMRHSTTTFCRTRRAHPHHNNNPLKLQTPTFSIRSTRPSRRRPPRGAASRARRWAAARRRVARGSCGPSGESMLLHWAVLRAACGHPAGGGNCQQPDTLHTCIHTVTHLHPHPHQPPTTNH